MIETTAISERDEGEEGGEDEGEHEQRADAAEHRLEQDARALVVGARVLGEGVEAGQVDGRAGDRRARERRARGLLGLRVLAERRVGVGLRIDDREGRAPVVGDEGLVAGRGVGGERASRAEPRSRRASSCARSARTPGESTDSPSGRVTTGNSGAVSPPVPR